MAFLENGKEPGCTLLEEAGDPVLRFSGDWVVSTAAAGEALLEKTSVSDASRIILDLSGIDHLDTSGAWLLQKFRMALIADQRTVSFEGVTELRQSLFDELQNYQPSVSEKKKPESYFLSVLERGGRETVGIWLDLKAMLHIFGAFGLILFTAVVRPKRLRLIATAVQFDNACIGAVPIVALMSFLIGAIISQQGGVYLQKLGADQYVIDLAGILVLREIGVILTAIMIAGRSGSAFTAELGAMRMREEIDALKVIGLSVTEVLLMPRILALMLALPILTFLADVSALMGAGLVTWTYLEIPPAAFLMRIREVVSLETFMVGLIKAPFMALIIGLIASVEGLKVGGSTDSLGRHTTLSVVKAIFLVIVVDGLFAIFFESIGV